MTLGTMSHTWPTEFSSVFKAQDSVHAYFSHAYHEIDNCTVAYSITTPRCWSSCDDPTSALTDYYSLWQCALYPNITNHVRSGTISKANSSYLAKYDLDTSLAKAANVTSMISTCLAGYCDSLGDCKQKYPDSCSATALSINGSMLNGGAMDSCILSICASHPAPVANTDFAGIGILTSYLLQVGIALLSALALSVLTLFIKRSQRQTGAMGQNSTHETTASWTGRDDRYNTLVVNRDDSRTWALYDSILAALVDFLKAQCFVAIASSIAALIVLKCGDTLSMLDKTALMTAGNAGIVPVTFTLYIIAAFNSTRKSWYLYALSFCTWILAIGAALSLQISYNQVEREWAGDTDFLWGDSYSEFPNACAQFAPWGICPNSHIPVLAPRSVYYYASCLPIIFGLTIWQLSTITRVSTFLTSLRVSSSYRYPWMPQAIIHSSATGLFAVPLYFFFKDILSLFATESVGKTWSFGQIIAITAWIPTVTGLVNNYADGVDAAHTKQLPLTYRTMTVSNNDVATPNVSYCVAEKDLEKRFS